MMSRITECPMYLFSTCFQPEKLRYRVNFYILIREGIRFMQNVTPPPPVFVKCPRFETP